MFNQNLKKVMKDELIEYLKKRKISTIDALWNHAKVYFKTKSIEMGGWYAYQGGYISIRIGKTERFRVSLAEVNEANSIYVLNHAIQFLGNDLHFSSPGAWSEALEIKKGLILLRSK